MSATSGVRQRRAAADRSTRRLRHGLAAVAGAGALMLASGCYTNFSAQTDQIYDTGQGVSDRTGDVDVLDATVVDTGANRGSVSASLIDNVHASDTLVAVTANTVSGDAYNVSQPSPLPTLTFNGAVVLGQDVAYGLKGTANASLSAGALVALTFTFKNASPVMMQVPVVTATGPYKSILTPTPSASPTASPLPRPTASPTPRKHKTSSQGGHGAKRKAKS